MKAKIRTISDAGRKTIVTLEILKPVHPVGRFDDNHPYAERFLGQSYTELKMMDEEKVKKVLEGAPDPDTGGKGPVRVGEAMRVLDLVVEYLEKKMGYERDIRTYRNLHLGECSIEQEVEK